MPQISAPPSPYPPFYDVVREYGAVGDGVHDDTTAFLNAIADATAAGGGVVWVPPVNGNGAYIITKTLDLSAGGVSIWGAGDNSHLSQSYLYFQGLAAGSNLLVVGSGTSLKGLTISTALTNYTMINAGNISGLVIEDCAFRFGSVLPGMVFGGAISNTWITRCYFSGAAPAASAAITMLAGGGASSWGTWITHNAVALAGPGGFLDAQGVHDITVAANVTAPAVTGTFGVRLGTTCVGIAVVGNDFTGFTSAVVDNSTTTTKVIQTAPYNFGASGGGGGGAVQSKTANYTMLAGDALVNVDATGGAVTITLPVTPTVGQVYMVKKVDASANAVTVADSSGTIDNAASVTISTRYQADSFVYDGTNWWIV